MSQHSLDTTDPLDQALLQSAQNETKAERRARLAQEVAVQAVSDSIDEQIEAVRKRSLGTQASGVETEGMLKHAGLDMKVMKLLLLGTSGAGKSTFLRQIRLWKDPTALDKEKESYRLAILLCIVTHTRLLLDLVDSEATPAKPSTKREPIAQRRMRLAPLLALEDPLRDILGAVSLKSGSASHASFVHHAANAQKRPRSAQGAQKAAARPADFAEADVLHVPARSWGSIKSSSIGLTIGGRPRSAGATSQSAGRLVGSCKDDIVALWDEAFARDLLSSSDISDGVRYFLTSLDRISALNWTPTEQDILHLRIETLGIEEHLVQINANLIYRIVDIAGARASRKQWSSHFSDSLAVIFIADISAFDKLADSDNEEGTTMTRVHEAMEVFRRVCNNKLLQRSAILVFLNKVDLLRDKCRHGTAALLEAFPEYDGAAQGSECLEHARRFFKDAFNQIYADAEERPQKRLYIHSMQATDTRTTRITLTSMQDALTRRMLKEIGLL